MDYGKNVLPNTSIEYRDPLDSLDPLQRISRLRHRLEDLRAQSRGDPDLVVFEAFSDVLSELKDIEGLLSVNSGLKKSQISEDGIQKEHIFIKCMKDVACIADIAESRHIE